MVAKKMKPEVDRTDFNNRESRDVTFIGPFSFFVKECKNVPRLPYFCPSLKNSYEKI